jgi:hypothetical protein
MFFGKNSALQGATTYTQFAARRTCKAPARASEEGIEAGEAPTKCAGNEEEPESCRVKRGDVESPWETTRTGGVSGFLLPTFLCRCKEK